MLRATANLFRPAPDAPLLADPAEVERRYARWRWSVFLSALLGYGFFYTTRLSTSVARDPMLSSGVLTAGQMGALDTAFLATYAVGKTVNGFVADRVSARRFFAAMLLVAALSNLAFGLSRWYAVFFALWAVNGWVQSAGTPTSGVLLARWFPSRGLGTRYALWSLSHHLGEGLTFLFTARLVAAASGEVPEPWRLAFLVPGGLCVAAAAVLYHTLADRPRAVGLPDVSAHEGGAAAATDAKAKAPDASSGRSLLTEQLGVLRSPWVLTCGLASAMMYVARYGINNWGIFYLQNEKGYSLRDAGAMIALFPVVGMLGTIMIGPISDRLMGSRRVPVTVAYNALLVLGLGALFVLPGHSRWLVGAALSCAGFATGGLLAFLGGLIAVDLSPRRVAGAALGVVGGFSYLGAGLQALVSGLLIGRGHRVVGGVHVYDFTAAKYVWFGAACLSLALTALLWRAELRVRRALAAAEGRTDIG